MRRRALVASTLLLASTVYLPQALASGVRPASAHAAFPVTVVVTHGALVPGASTTSIDTGIVGPSAGDQIILFKRFSSPAGYVTGTLTTVAAATPEAGKEIRQAQFTFSFGGNGVSSIEVSGTSVYDTAQPTLSVGTVTTRAVTGGTGKFIGARGYVVTTHPTPAKWIHKFHLQVG